MPNSSKQSGRLLCLVTVAPLLWGLILAYGAYRGSNPPETADLRRGLIVSVCVVGFTFFWAALLLLRSRKLRKNALTKDNTLKT